MTIDLEQYKDKAPKLGVKKLYNSQEDIQNALDFNKKIKDVRQSFLAKEKRSCISAKKLVLTD